MIFVTVGTQKFQFNRLLYEIDRLISEGCISEKVICQSGYSTYRSKFYQEVPFMSKKKYEKYIQECRILINHAGVGTILSAKKLNKAVIVVPRLSKYKEHVDDHQLQIAEGFGRKKLVFVSNVDQLGDKLKDAKKCSLLAYPFNKDNFNFKLCEILRNI